MTETIPLAADFAAASAAEWRALAEKALKGRPLDSLSTRTADGLVFAPLYGPADAAAPARPVAAPWTVVQRVDHPDAAAANRLALEDLAQGATGLSLVFAGSPTAYGYGLPPGDVSALAAALAGVVLDALPLRLEAGPHGLAAAAALLAVAERHGVAAQDLDVAVGLDPLGAFAASGRLAEPWPAEATRHGAAAADLARHGLSGSLFLADGRPWHAAGASEAQELAAALAAAVAYLRLLVDAGLDAAPASRVAFSLAADDDQFLTIAKLRALRSLWARILADCGHPATPASIHAETAWRMLTRRDPMTNVLRATVAAFAAGVGGADAVTVLPFTTALGLPDGFARRLARNLQTILLEESNLWRVADPAAGSGAVEAMTEALAGAAWERFRDIERAGGLAAAIANGSLAGAVAEAAAARRGEIARRKRPITGTSEFPLLGEAAAEVLDAAPVAPRPPHPPAAFEHLLADARAGREIGRGVEAGAAAGEPPHPGAAVAPLPAERLAAPFEALRDAAAAHAAATERTPTVFLAALGPVAAHGARSAWTTNLLAAGGIAATGGDGYPDVATAVAAFAASGLSLALLSAPDAAYAAEGPAAVAALAAAGATVVVAGKPAEAAAMQAAGAVQFLTAGSDAVAALAELQGRLGIGRS